MHWESHELALPKLARNKRWMKIADTSLPCAYFEETYGENEAESGTRAREERFFSIGSRCIAIFSAVSVKRNRSEQ